MLVVFFNKLSWSVSELTGNIMQPKLCSLNHHRILAVNEKIASRRRPFVRTSQCLIFSIAMLYYLFFYSHSEIEKSPCF